MTITLTPEMEAKLAHRAKVCNLSSPEEYLAATVAIADGYDDDQIVELLKLRRKVAEARTSNASGLSRILDESEIVAMADRLDAGETP